MGAHGSQLPQRVDAVQHQMDFYVNGLIEGEMREKLKIDTGAQQTVLNAQLVPKETLSGETIQLRMADGFVTELPVATVKLQFGEQKFSKLVVVMENMEEDALLGSDLPVLADLLRQHLARQDQVPKVEAVATRAGEKKRQEREEEDDEAISTSGVDPVKLSNIFDMDDDMFLPTQPRERKTRREKRKAAREFAIEKDNSTAHIELDEADLCEELKNDPSLGSVWKSVDRPNFKYVVKDGLLFHHSMTPTGEQLRQLVIPRTRQRKVIKVVHSIPLAGHLGRRKTTQRVLQWFFWPGVNRDIAMYCRTCVECQKAARVTRNIAPLMPLPVVDEAFSRIAMDVVGPLQRSKPGNKYILTIMDYGTKYPEAFPL